MKTSFPIAGYVLTGLATLVLLIFGAGFWATQSVIASALVIPGTVESTKRSHVVQHPHGGLVAEVLVREGDHVAAGDLLIRLDSGYLEAALHMTRASIFELEASQSRLRAQFDGQTELRFAPDLSAQAQGDPTLAALLVREQLTFGAVRAAVAIALDQVGLRKRQTAARLAGVEAQNAATQEQHTLVTRALSDQQQLLSRGLAQAATILALEREAASLQGALGTLAAQRTEAETLLIELDAEAHALTAQHRQDAAEGIAALVPRLRTHQREALSLTRELGQTRITAPVAGRVQDLLVHHPHAVLPIAETLLSVVPPRADHKVLARIAPGDIDQVYPGQDVTLRLSALEAQNTPEVAGVLTRLSASVLTDPRSEARYFEAEISIENSLLASLSADSVLTAGMPVEVLIKTGAGTPLAFLLKPVRDYFARALRES